MKPTKLPVTVLSGFLGSGKTTLLNYILHHKQDLRVAVIVNDMSVVNIDAKLVKNEKTLSRTDEKLVEMSNGCICCTLREDLMIEVEKLARENRFDYLLIESTGISEPLPIAQTFTFSDKESGINLSQFSRLDTLVTVVDCFNFFDDFNTDELLLERELVEDTSDERTIVNLITDQIEFANVIVMNKTDLILPKEVNLLETLLHQLNPGAKIIRAQFGKIDPAEILNTGLFDCEKAALAPGLIEEINKEHKPETEEYGISSVVFSAQKPFHPERFWSYLHQDYPDAIIRAKGLFWLAALPHEALSFSQAGASSRIDNAGVWWASMPFAERIGYPEYIENQKQIESRWSKEFGDRLNELVFIGQDINKEKLLQDLENCLLTNAEVLQYLAGKKFKNPFFEHTSMP